MWTCVRIVVNRSAAAPIETIAVGSRCIQSLFWPQSDRDQPARTVVVIFSALAIGLGKEQQRVDLNHLSTTAILDHWLY